MRWLCVYDNIAWWTTDSLLASPEEEKQKLGKEWFCFNSSEANPYSRALVKANELTKPIRDTTKVRFNRYIKRENDGTLSGWALPAFSQAGEAVYGGEFYYRFDRTGNNLLENNEYFQGNFRGFKTDRPREIWLDYKEMDKPSFGAIFFVWYYKKYITRIFIENKKSRSTVFFDKNKGEYYWSHYEQ